MTRVAWMPSACRRLAGDQSGAVVVLMAVAMVPLLALTGVAVDSARAYFVQSRLSRALDAAGLAGGQDYDDAAKRDAAIRKYFDVNFPPGFLGARVTGLTWTMNDEAREITLTAGAALDTTIMRLVGKDRVDVAARSVIKQQVRGLELVLVMDNTGSMINKVNGVRKIDAMKAGAADLVAELYGKQEVVKNMWVGLVPFTTTVNIGRPRTNWLTGYNPDDFKISPLGWKGCIEERVPRTEAPHNEPRAGTGPTGVPLSRDITDDPPNIESWRPFRYASVKDENYYPKAKDVTEVDYNNGGTNDGTGPNRSCPPPITPLVSPKTTVLNAITAMGAFSSSSGTMNHVGLVWAWRMLSPRWRGLWGGEMNQEGMPFDYGDPKRSKAVVILTDGDNTFPDVYTSYGRQEYKRLIASGGDSDRKAELNKRLTQVCNSLRTQGIVVYTITFGVGSSNPIWTLFRGCATKPEYHFDSKDSEGLRRAFRTIGGQLANLRVAQ
ncbi:pilus assembly protein TadG-related protein [Azospirillum sp.]|uniref:pilus assembly protein TadG-related protein n=1 Tax=Azospirillum sp. TaxID=34012 RepID=UPI002D4F8A5B|nr:pilus assembly protein TadG-related protein [Azospirillum sp.]HYD66415.1 pilus assembly protein TadG-related protein [Azospirillum sp.]